MNNKRPPSLRRRLIGQNGLMMAVLVLMSAGAVIGINGLHHDFGDALRGYQELRVVYEVGLNVASAQSALRADPPTPEIAHNSIETALLKLRTNADLDAAQPKVQALISDLTRAENRIDPSALDSAMGRLAQASSDIRTRIVSAQQAADHKRRITLLIVIGLSIVVVIAGIVIGYQQYRSVMRPLRRLGNAVRQVAAGQFQQTADASGDSEFVSLASDFNRMAAQLDLLYRDLEQQVQIKSKELVRSERLASVGYLAAGVAHEINNPLSIIAGFGERALQLMEREPDFPNADRMRNAVEVVCEQAFRCKQITDRLLSLARPGSDDFGPVLLSEIAEEIISSIAALPEFRDRKIILETDPQQPAIAHARDGEIKQVILNLAINSLEAVPSGNGLVRITIASKDDQVELVVADNGRGMSMQTLEHAFEPFFTSKRGSGRGTGLGLSITHAIVADHGGTITAHSDGLGLGSRFVVRLPAAPKGAEYVND